MRRDRGDATTGPRDQIRRTTLRALSRAGDALDRAGTHERKDGWVATVLAMSVTARASAAVKREVGVSRRAEAARNGTSRHGCSSR
jgi:hypothetical protein